MPPKGSGKGRKKAAADTEVLKNGATNGTNEPGDVGEQKIKAKQIFNKDELIPEEDSPKSVENGEKVENKKESKNGLNGTVDLVEDNVTSKPKGAKYQVKSKGRKFLKSDKKYEVEETNDKQETVEQETLNEKVDEVSTNEESAPAKRGRKAQSKITVSAEDVPLKVEESVPKKVAGRKAKQQSADIVPKEESTAEMTSLDAMKSSPKGTRSRQKSTDVASEDAKIEEGPLQDQSSPKKKRGKGKGEEVKETVPKKMRAGRTTRQPSPEVTKEAIDLKVDEIPVSEQKEPVLESEKCTPKKATGGRNARKPSADISCKEEESSKAKTVDSIVEEAEQETYPENKESAPKKTKRGRNARHQSEDNVPEEIEPETNEPEQKVIELSPKIEEVAPKKPKGGRLFKQTEIDTFLKKKVAPVRQGERKRKNGKKEISKTSKDASTEEIDVIKKCRVSILRRKSLDNLAMSNFNETETKTKAAKGSSKVTGRGKRAASEDPSDAKKAKVTKETNSKSSKKDKIPDVTVLDFSNESTSPDGKTWNLKIASWNINGIRAWLEKEGMSYLKHEKPDILCIQETKCSEEKLPKEANVDGYHCYWLAGDKDGYSGVGLLSKEKPLNVEYGIGVEEHDKEGRVITAEYEKFYLVATYVPNAGRGLVRLKYRMQWDTDFRAYLKKLDEKKPVVLCGDLNVAHEEIDLANPKTNKKNAGFTKEERDGFSTLLSEGFIDSFRHLYPDAKNAYTFWTYMMNARAKNVGWRLDYFVISKRLKDHLCDSVIRKEVMGSDHCPIGLFLCV